MPFSSHVCWNHALIEKGLRQSAEVSMIPPLRWNHALIEKGLRRFLGRFLLRGRYGWNHALIEKGLRPRSTDIKKRLDAVGIMP